MKNLEQLQKLKDLLPCERFILGGSHAMKLHGITLSKEPGDFDIIIEVPRYGCHDMLEKLQRDQPNPKFTGEATMSYSFYFEGVKCDVWIKSELSEYPLLSYEGILVNSITDIVDWKMRLKRSKDWVQLMQWSLSLFDKKKFDAQLMEIGTEGNGDSSFNGDANAPEKKYVKDPLDPLEDYDDLPF